MFNTILVTGCGGDIGFGIGKILKTSKIAKTIIGSDIHNDHAGTAIFDQCCLINRADSTDYFESLEKVIDEYNVDMVIPTSEPELRVLLKEGCPRKIGNSNLIYANQTALEIGFDKLKTAQFLDNHNLLAPWTTIVKEGSPKELPCIIKDRYGAGSKSVGIADKDSVERLEKQYPDYIWQELLLPNNQEYTCGVYRSRDGEIRSAIMKRELSGDFTGKGEIVKNSNIEKLLYSVAKELDLEGAINVQLRLTERGPVIFEINPRFSSTVVFRHLMGFQDLIWSLLECAGKSIPNYQELKEGTRFYRISDEYITT